jgi:hypothetical protein
MMTRTTLPDGSVRYAPKVWYRGRRQRGATTGILVAVVPLGVAGFIRVGPAVGVPLVGGTALVTLLLVVLWRVTLPRCYHVTVTSTDITLRSYGRTTTIRRNHNLRGHARLLRLQYELSATYVIVSGDGGRFKLHVDMLPEQDLDALLKVIPVDAQPAAVTPKQLDAEFPGLLPASTLHPHRFAIGVVVAIVVAIVAGFVVYTTVFVHDPDEIPTPTVRGLDLRASDAAKQQQLQDQARLLVSPGPDWRSGDPYVHSCHDGTWQRIISVGGTTTRPYTNDDRARLTAVARAAGMVERDVAIEGEAVRRLLFEDPKTGATLELSVESTYTGLSTGSACVGAR